MSRKDLRVCDYCERESHRGSGAFKTEYDPDQFEAWWTIYVDQIQYDFCSLNCLYLWAKRTHAQAEAFTSAIKDMKEDAT